MTTNQLYAHPDTGEIETRYEWLSMYRSHRVANAVGSWFGYEVEEGESYPSDEERILGILEPVHFDDARDERYVAEILISMRNMRMRR